MLSVLPKLRNLKELALTEEEYARGGWATWQFYPSAPNPHRALRRVKRFIPSPDITAGWEMAHRLRMIQKAVKYAKFYPKLETLFLGQLRISVERPLGKPSEVTAAVVSADRETFIPAADWFEEQVLVL